MLELHRKCYATGARHENRFRPQRPQPLREGESLSNLMEQSLRDEVNRRRNRAEFIARGLAAREEARRTGVYYTADEVHAELRDMLTQAEARAVRKAKV